MAVPTNILRDRKVKSEGAVLRARFEMRVRVNAKTGCHEWTGAIYKDKGTEKWGRYGRAFDGRRTTSAHRVAWQLYRGEIPDSMLVLHKCDNPICVNPDHLFIGTHKDNMHDMMEKGRNPGGGVRGELQHNAKLTASDVLAIRVSELSTTKLAELYGVCFTTVKKVRQRKSWSWL